ncbi:MAG: hypothetical protein ABS76_17070 [Pelagibacterium sp. SCN 64-44]|nr:MAG: hypothetical protein ABS76_17070 [Pelagibacterium sp. SCN 64-44]
MTEETGHFRREDCDLHYWIDGPPDAPAVLFSHGATLDNESWLPQTEHFRQHYRVIRWDMRGHGRSRPWTGTHTIDRFADDMVALLDHLGLDRVALVGLSLGGYASQAVARRHAERVSALAVFDATNLYDTPLSRFMTFMMAQSSRLIGLYPWRTLVDLTAKQSAVQPQVQAYIRRVVGQLTKSEYIAIWGAVQTGLRHDSAYRFGGPMLLGMGDKDNVGVVAAGMRHWAQSWPTAQFAIIPDAGHCSNQDNPDAVNALLAQWLDRI